MPGRREMTLEEQKRELLARSEVYRQAMAARGREIQQSLAWVPRTVNMARRVAPIMAFGVPLAGMMFFRKKTPFPQARKAPSAPAKKGLLAMVLGGIEIYNRLRPILTAFAQHRANHDGAVRKPRTQAAPSR